MAPIANLTVRVSAQIAEFQKSFEDASKTAKKFASDFESIATKAAVVGTFFGTIAADIAGSMARGLGNALKDAIKFSSEFSNAFLGLGSVARHFGTDTDLATKAARALSADGLLPLKDSATGLKNLLSAGFNLPEATKLMGAFKDSAAFGRQGALSFGDAVRTATEGIRNGNSILVDNAGITKNLSQILKEAGFSAQDLSKVQSDAGVRLALYNGILKESAAFSGDAAKLTQTYTGQVTRLESAYNNTLGTIGTVITQNATVAKGIGFISDAFIGLNGKLSDNRNGFNLVSDAVIGMVGVLAGTVRALDTVQGAFNTIDTAIATFASHVIEGVKTLADSLISLVKIAASIPGSSIAIGAMANEIVGLAGISKGAGIELKTLSDRIENNNSRSKDWHSSLSTLAGSLDKLKGDMTATRGQTVELGAAATGMGRAASAAAPDVDKLSKSTETAREKAMAFRLEVTQDLIPSVKRLGDEIKIVQPLTAEWAREIVAKLGNEAIPVVKHLGEEVGISGDRFAQAAEQAARLAAEGDRLNFGTLSHALDAVGSQIDGFFGRMISGVGSAVRGIDALAQATTAFGQTMAAIDLGASIGKILQPLLGLRTGKLGDLLGTNRTGRSLVEDFAKSFASFNLDTLKFDTNGFDILHAKLADLGVEGEKLWIALTQGVGKSNPQQAVAVIDLINDALSRQKTAETEVGAAATAANAEQQAAAAALKSRLAELSSEYDSLNKSVSAEAPEEVMGVIEQQQRARMAAIADEKTALQAKADEDVRAQTEAQKRIEIETKASHDRLQDYFNQNEFEVPYRFKPTNGIPGGSGLDVPALASGGIVRRPTLALVGEKGPEAVVPLSQFGRSGGGQPMLVQLVMPNGQVLLEQMVKARKGLGI